MAERIPVSGISELVLEVLDLDRAVRFYTEQLGLALAARSEQRAWLLAGRSRIGLWTPQVGLAHGRGGVHVHYAFHVEDADFDAIVAKLDQRGLDPEVISFEDDQHGRAVYVNDPDGNVVEFWTFDVADWEAA